jgi:hypothetical protein
MTVCGLVGRYEHFGGIHCIHLQARSEQSWGSLRVYRSGGMETSHMDDRSIWHTSSGLRGDVRVMAL